MSSELPAVTAKQVLKALATIGFVHVGTRGSHAKLAHRDGRKTVVPMHGGRDVPRGLLRTILRQAGLSPAEFSDLI